MIVGFDNAEDAGVVEFAPGRALIQTLDFFTPIVDDPWTFGAIAATNSISDVYAMGGEPLTALNILCFPDKLLGVDVLRAILAGARDKCAEAGIMVVGGHSVRDDELKFGLSVSGWVDPERVWLNHGARAGDVLVLTKPVGTGILTTALKRGLIDEAGLADATASMLRLNRGARDAARDLDVHACTDITGNGIGGHGWEMARGSGRTLRIRVADLPLLPRVDELAAAGCSPGGTKANGRYVGDGVRIDGAPEHFLAIALDPQTSGGLLFALPPGDADRLIERLVAAGEPAWRIGAVEDGPPVVVFSS